jgi:hypothetical protein
VLFTTAVEAINTLAAAQAQHRLKAELKRFLAPRILVCDELGYLPIDKTGADLLFQIISGRYENGSTIITTNQIYKHWSRIFNHDSTITSAVLDRLLHHAETVIIEGKSYRMKDQIDPPLFLRPLRPKPAEFSAGFLLASTSPSHRRFLHRRFRSIFQRRAQLLSIRMRLLALCSCHYGYGTMFSRVAVHSGKARSLCHVGGAAEDWNSPFSLSQGSLYVAVQFQSTRPSVT